MADLADAIVAILRADAGIGALVGNGDSPETFRICPLVLPQNWTSPAITYQRITRDDVQNLAGSADRSVGVFQLDAWAKDAPASPGYAKAVAVANAVRTALDNYAATIAGVAISAVTVVAERDEFEDETGAFRVSLDFQFSHKEG